MDVVNGELVRWTKSSRSLDILPLRVFIIKSIRSHHLHLCNNLGWSYISDVWMAHVLLFWSTWSVTTLRSFLVSSFSIGTFLVLPSVVPWVPLTQLLFQIVVLLSEALHDCYKSLNLSLEGSWAWFVSLYIVGGCYRVSEYHATLYSGSVCMAYKLLSSPQTAQINDSKKSPMSHTVLIRLQQHQHNKKRRPYREHQCGAGQIPSKGQVRIFLQLQSVRAGINYVYLFSEGLWVFIVVQNRTPRLASQVFSLCGKSPLMCVYSRILLVLEFHSYWDSMD